MMPEKCHRLVRQRQHTILQKQSTKQIPLEKELLHSQSMLTTKTLYKTEAGFRLTIDQGKQYLSVHAEVYVCADRLGIDELKEHACTHFVDIAKDDGMALYHLPFYGDTLGYIHENTIMERAHVSAHAERGTGEGRWS